MRLLEYLKILIGMTQIVGKKSQSHPQQQSAGQYRPENPLAGLIIKALRVQYYFLVSVRYTSIAAK
jgi:hypothetical protein